jgi:signal transduction histidine kinase
MSAVTGTSAGMAYLAQWMSDPKSMPTLESLLTGWLTATGWKQSGLIWPATGKPTLAKLVRADGTADLIAPPAEVPGVLSSLQSGSPTVVWQLSSTSARLYALLQPVGHPVGVAWIEKPNAEPFTELERSYLLLSLRMIERSTVMGSIIGTVMDSDKLQQRLQDTAVIAGRMAHDFDNILTGMIGFADLSLPLLATNPQVTKYIQQIGDVGKRGIQFTQQLHQLNRAAQAKPHPGLLSVALGKEELRLRPHMPMGLSIGSSIPADIGPVGLEVGPLGTVLGHVLENAVEACQPNGRVQIAARAVELDTAAAKGYLGFLKPGTYIELQVRDDGVGIKPENRPKLFAEPFFTTKVRHRGLGLAIVFRTLVAHGGGIRIEHHAPEPGTTVTLLLPPATVRSAVAPTNWKTTTTPLGAYS